MARHYLDFASTAPLRPPAKAALNRWLESGAFGDPSRPHEEGRLVSAAIEEARDELAGLLGVRARQVVFTSSGSEAINWVNAAAVAGAGDRPIALEGVEHSAVRLSAERRGPLRSVEVDRSGRIDLASAEQALSEQPAPCLFHCQFGNHEVGTIQPIEAVAALCRRYSVPIHVDACAAIGQLAVDVVALEPDYLSLSGHKFGAPAGVGALVVRRGLRIAGLLVGGDQERGRRAGLEAVLPIVGIGAAARELRRPGELAAAAERARQQTSRIAKAALSVSGVSQYGDPENRLPHIVCFGIEGVEAEGVVLGLDRRGLAVHSGSACSSEAIEPSPVLLAMGVDAERSLRCSVGWSTKDEDVAAFEENFAEVVAELRALAS